MNFEEILTIFGGTIFADEYRGDFESVKRDIEQREPSTKSKSSPNSRAEILLLKAVFETLRGEYTACQANLDQLKALETDNDEKWSVRCRVYERFNLICMVVPPAIRFRSNLGGSASTIREVELGAPQEFMIPLPNPPDPTAMEMFENTLAQFSMTANIASWMSACSHPQFAHAGLQANVTRNQGNVRDIPLPKNIQFASLLGLEKTAAYFLQLQCKIEASRTPLAAQTAFQSLQDAYTAAKDAVGMAIYHISVGDRLSSPPFTSPIALNLIVDGALTGWQNDEWDRAEPSFCLTDDATVAKHYSMALSVVQNVNAPRVKAAVYLRRACIQHMAGIRANSHACAEEAKKRFKEALRNLSLAHRGFSLDESNLHIVDCHELLLNISCRRHAKVEQDAAAIGAWGKSSGNTVLAQFLGILMMRFGWRYYLDYSRVDLVHLCCSCARACFNALDDEIFKLQARLAEAQLTHLSGVSVAAQVILDEERKDMKALKHMKNLTKASAPNVDTLRWLMADLLTGFNRIALTIYSSANNTNPLQIWLKEYQDLKDGMNLSQMLGPLESKTTAVTVTSQSTNRARDAVALIKDPDQVQALEGLYKELVNKGYAALDRADVDGEGGFEACIREFLRKSETFNSPEDSRLGFRIVAHALLDDLARAHQILPRAIATTLLARTRDLQPLELRKVRIKDVPISNEFRIDFDAANYAIELCFVSRDWRRGATLVHDIENVFPEYLHWDRLPTEGSQWKLATLVACIYEHKGQLDNALPWYLWARRTMETQRSHTEDPDARRGMRWSFHTAELFAGLTRVALRLHNSSDDKHKLKRPALWGLPALTWREQAFIFMEESFARTLLELMIAYDTTKPEVLQTWAARSYLYDKSMTSNRFKLCQKAVSLKKAMGSWSHPSGKSENNSRRS